MLHLTLILVSLLAATTAFAHPGHGETTGLVHYFVEPLHVMGVVVLVLALIAGARVLYRRHARTSP